MLRQCPNLTVLRIRYWDEEDFGDIDEPICVLSKLEELNWPVRAKNLSNVMECTVPVGLSVRRFERDGKRRQRKG